MGPQSNTDADVVQALLAGDTSALGDMYDRYSDRLYSYAITLLRNPDAAADAVSDTFLLAASRMGQLRDPSRLRPWLYAICRNECMHYHRRAAHVAPLEDSPEMSGADVDFDAGLGAAEAASLVSAALPGLNDNDREVIELAMRHDFDAAEIGAALGVNTNNASARVSRARGQLQRCIGALVMFRSGGRACPELRTIVARAEGFDALTRKRVARHIDDCDECSKVKKSAMLEIAMASALPIAAAPTGLRERVFSDASASRASTLDAGRRPFDSQGWPRPPARRGRLLLVGATAAGVLIALLAVGFSVGPLAEGNVQQVMAEASQAPTAVTSTQAAPAPSGAGSGVPSAVAIAVTGVQRLAVAATPLVPEASQAQETPAPEQTLATPDSPVTTYQPPETSAPLDSPTSTTPNDPTYPSDPPPADQPTLQPPPTDYLTVPDVPPVTGPTAR